MPITSAVANSFKKELLEGIHNLDADTFKIALIKPSMAGTYGPASTNYSDITGNSDETSGTGYTAGGQDMTGVSVALDTGVAIVDFTDPEWGPSASIAARGFMIYNASKANRAVAVYDFGADTSVTNGTFIARLPVPAAATALIRLS